MHPLDGSRLKVSRASDQLDALDKSIQRFRKSEPYRIVANIEKKPGWYVMRARVLQDIDPMLGVIIGEIAHDLKSALDGLVWQLARVDSGVFSTITEFPIFLHKKRSLFTTTCPSGRLKELCVRHVAMLERLQPYKRGNGHRHNSLFLLYELNRADKHRTIQIIGGRVIYTALSIPAGPFTASGLNSIIMTGKNRPFVNGAKLGEYQFGRDSGRVMDMEFKAEVQIQFAKGCDAVEKLRVVPTLSTITNHVSHIIESFASEF